MPKIKTRSAAKKRLKATGKKGKIVITHQKAGNRHLLQQKSKKQKRLAGQRIVAKAYGKVLKRMLAKAAS